MNKINHPLPNFPHQFLSISNTESPAQNGDEKTNLNKTTKNHNKRNMLNILLLTTRHTKRVLVRFCLRVHWNWWRSVMYRKCVWRDCKQIETGQKRSFLIKYLPLCQVQFMSLSLWFLLLGLFFAIPYIYGVL